MKNYSFQLTRWKIYWNVKAFAKGGPIPVQNISLPFFIFIGANRCHFSAIFGTDKLSYRGKVEDLC